MFDDDEVISDSEGEQDFELRPSTIDQFTATAIQPSPVSFFAPASTPAAPSAIASSNPADQSAAHLYPQAAAADEPFMSLAERAKMRQRRPAAGTQQSSIISEPKSSVSKQAPAPSILDDLIVISSTDESDDENAFIQSRVGKKQKSTSKPVARPTAAATPPTGPDRPASLPPIAHLAPTDFDDFDELDLLAAPAPNKSTKSSKNSPAATKSSKQTKAKPALDDERVKTPPSTSEVKKKTKKVKETEKTMKVKETEKPAKVSTSKAEELFKSREFIEDSDDDQLVLAAYPPAASSRPAPIPISKSSAKPTPTKPRRIVDSDDERQPVTVASSTSRLHSSGRARTVYVELDPPQFLHKSSPTPASASDASKSKKKKRKSTGDDDDDAFDEDADPIPKPTTKKRKSTTTTDNPAAPDVEPTMNKRKSKKQEDDEGEYDAAPEVSPLRPASSSKSKPASMDKPVEVAPELSKNIEKKRKAKKSAQSEELPLVNEPGTATVASSGKKKRKSDAITEGTDLSPLKKARIASPDQDEAFEDLGARRESPPAPPAKPTTPAPKPATTPHSTKVASTPSMATPLSSHSHSPYLRDAPGKENQSPGGMSALLHKMKLHAPSRLAGSSRRSSLSRIAPLHSQLKSPPPVPPPVSVPKKKSNVDAEADEEDWQAWIRDDGGGTVVIKKLWLRCSEGIEEWGEWTLMQKRAYVRAVKEGRGRG